MHWVFNSYRQWKSKGIILVNDAYGTTFGTRVFNILVHDGAAYYVIVITQALVPHARYWHCISEIMHEGQGNN